MFPTVFIGIFIIVCTVSNGASGAPFAKTSTLYDAIIAKCPTFSDLVKFKNSEMFKSCENFTQIQSTTELNLKDHKKELMCLLGYDNIVAYCTTAPLLNTKTKTLSVPKIMPTKIEEICDSSTVVPPKTSKVASETLLKAVSTKDDCQNLCLDEFGMIELTCTVSYNFGKWAEQIQTILQKQKTAGSESVAKHKILPDSSLKAAAAAPILVPKQGVIEPGPQTKKDAEPGAESAVKIDKLPQLPQNSKTPAVGAQDHSNISKDSEPGPQAQPQNSAPQPVDAALIPKKLEEAQAGANPLETGKKPAQPLPEQPEVGKPALKIPISSQNPAKNPAPQNVVQHNAEAKAAPAVVKDETKNLPALSPPKVEEGDKVEIDNTDVDQEQDQLQPDDNLDAPPQQEAEQLDQQQNIAEEEADDEDQILKEEAKQQEETKEKPAAEKPKAKTQIEITKPDKIDESESVSGYGADSTMDGDSYFFSYFMLLCIIFIVGYVCYHNKQKILALILEGRRGKRQYRSRRPNSANYHKLDSNLEEAISSTCTKSTTNVIY